MSDGIDFEAGSQASTACGICARPIAYEYWEANGKVVCPPCKTRVETQGFSGTPVSRFATAAALGIGAMLVGTLAWWAVAKYAQLQTAIIAIGIGWLVGMAVRRGSQGLGGWLYQVLAVALTYLSIVLAYTVLIVGEIDPLERAGLGAAQWLDVFVYSLGAPVMRGWGSILSVLIIGFGLFQAWKLNLRTSILWAGPHRVGEAVMHSSLPPLPGTQPPAPPDRDPA